MRCWVRKSFHWAISGRVATELLHYCFHLRLVPGAGEGRKTPINAHSHWHIANEIGVKNNLCKFLFAVLNFCGFVQSTEFLTVDGYNMDKRLVSS